MKLSSTGAEWLDQRRRARHWDRFRLLIFRLPVQRRPVKCTGWWHFFILRKNQRKEFKCWNMHRDLKSNPDLSLVWRVRPGAMGSSEWQAVLSSPVPPDSPFSGGTDFHRHHQGQASLGLLTWSGSAELSGSFGWHSYPKPVYRGYPNGKNQPWKSQGTPGRCRINSLWLLPPMDDPCLGWLKDKSV